MEVINKLKQSLRGILTDPSATQSNLEEYLQLLLDLKEPVDEVRSEFLQGRRNVLTKMLTEEPDVTKTITEVIFISIFSIH